MSRSGGNRTWRAAFAVIAAACLGLGLVAGPITADTLHPGITAFQEFTEKFPGVNGSPFWDNTQPGNPEYFTPADRPAPDGGPRPPLIVTSSRFQFQAQLGTGAETLAAAGIAPGQPGYVAAGMPAGLAAADAWSVFYVDLQPALQLVDKSNGAIEAGIVALRIGPGGPPEIWQATTPDQRWNYLNNTNTSWLLRFNNDGKLRVDHAAYADGNWGVEASDAFAFLIDEGIFVFVPMTEGPLGPYRTVTDARRREDVVSNANPPIIRPPSIDPGLVMQVEPPMPVDTVAPVTQAPVTQAPVTQAPATQPPGSPGTPADAGISPLLLIGAGVAIAIIVGGLMVVTRRKPPPVPPPPPPSDDCAALRARCVELTRVAASRRYDADQLKKSVDSTATDLAGAQASLSGRQAVLAETRAKHAAAQTALAAFGPGPFDPDTQIKRDGAARAVRVLQEDVDREATDVANAEASLANYQGWYDAALAAWESAEAAAQAAEAEAKAACDAADACEKRSAASSPTPGTIEKPPTKPPTPPPGPPGPGPDGPTPPPPVTPPVTPPKPPIPPDPKPPIPLPPDCPDGATRTIVGNAQEVTMYLLSKAQLRGETAYQVTPDQAKANIDALDSALKTASIATSILSAVTDPVGFLVGQVVPSADSFTESGQSAAIDGLKKLETSLQSAQKFGDYWLACPKQRFKVYCRKIQTCSDGSWWTSDREVVLERVGSPEWEVGSTIQIGTNTKFEGGAFRAEVKKLFDHFANLNLPANRVIKQIETDCAS